MTRFLKSHSGYVAMVSGVLALGVGINLLVFSIVNALWLRPLPVVDPERVVTILQAFSTVTSLDYAGAESIRWACCGASGHDRIQRGVQATRRLSPDTSQPLETIGVTPSYFSVLGIPIRGRAFTEKTKLPGAEAVGIISDRLWARAFGRDPAVLGSVVATSLGPLRIVGIAPRYFEGARRGEHVDLWVPTAVVRNWAPGDRQLERPSMMVFTRLLPGQALDAVQQRYRGLRTLPDGSQLPPDRAPTLVPLTDVFGTPDSPTILIRERGTFGVVLGLSGLVLLGACATIAALALTHYERRRPELALKSSLGAGRARLARELIAEVLVVGLAGTAGSMFVGLLCARAIPALSLPGGVNVGRLDLSVDWRLCLMALAASLLTLAVASFVPLSKVTHGRLAGEVSTGQATTPTRSVRARRRLLTLQVFATTVVLIASGLFVRTVLYSYRIAAGFDIDQTVFVTVQEKPLQPTPGSSAREVGLARRAELTGILEQLPSVRAVAGGVAPIGSDALVTLRTIRMTGREVQTRLGILHGTPNLLSTLGVPLLEGRALDRSDTASTTPTPVVMTRSLAERLWLPGEGLGQAFSIREAGGSYVVVGIAADFAFGTLSQPAAGVVVTARGDLEFRASHMVLQTNDSGAVIAALATHLPDRVVRVATGRGIVERDIAQQRLGAWAFSGFGLVALLLGIGGVFGLVLYLVQARRREFGVRMALGATSSGVVRNAVSAAFGPVGVGVAMGLMLGAVVSRVFSSLLVGIGSLDLETYAGVALVIVVPAVLAATAAAWQLHRLAPSEALRRH